MSFKRETPKLKPLKGSDKMPRDFWNYRVHPITGWSVIGKNYYKRND